MAPPPPAHRLAAMLLLLVAVLPLLQVAPGITAAGGVFQVRRKFPIGTGTNNISAHRAHDAGRRLAVADFPLGRRGSPPTGLYFTEMKLGTPPKPYHVLVDTGSTFPQVNCISCENCTHDKRGHHHFYDPKASSTGSTVHCNQGLCAVAFGNHLDCTPNMSCPEYRIGYGDGSATYGFLVTDALHFDQVTGDGQTKPANATISFGFRCVTAYDGQMRSSNQALDGILGFARDDTSMLSQLSAAGIVKKKIFAHCFDARKGGGIFSIGGEVVHPKVKTTPLVPRKTLYHVNLKSINVGDTTLQLPAHVFETGAIKGTIIDSGTTLTYLPELVFKNVLEEVFKHQDITFHHVQDFLCFQYSGCLDDGFPTVTFHFKDDLALHVYPHEYFFPNGDGLYCMGFQNSALGAGEKDIVLLGDLVLSNKLVVYDLENQVIGWTAYNCSSSIKIKDDKTGKTYAVNSQDISTGWIFH